MNILIYLMSILIAKLHMCDQIIAFVPLTQPI
jgi:hypothetical protein